MFSDNNVPTPPQQDPAAKAMKHAAAIEAWLIPIFQKAPHLPASAKQTIVDIAPWLALISGVLGIVSVLSASAFVSMLFSFAFVTSGILPILFTVGMLIALLGSVLDLLAYKPLTEKKKLGWNYVFYGVLLTGVSFVLNAIAGQGMLGSLVGLVIGLWILFEVRDQYTA
jgi:uncharacterized BrkB/YihY/UPF0761 family membrane protein